MQFRIVPRHDDKRVAVEDMVAAVFSDEYGATVTRFPAIMIAVFDTAGQPICAASLRDQDSGFFTEHYLDQPIEQVIAAQTTSLIRRDEIVELGSLAARRPGALLVLLRGFAGLGLASGHRWGVFTATRRLRRLASRMAIPYADLGAAIADRVPDRSSWGSYYDHDPRVCAVEGTGAKNRLTGPAFSENAPDAMPVASFAKPDRLVDAGGIAL